MKRLLPLATTALLLCSLAACKTNEENYRRAYETAKQRESENIDPTIYDRIRREARPVTSVIDGDTVAMKREYVAITADQGLTYSAIKRYNVVVGQFKQLFHAKSMVKRFNEGGYDSAFIVQTREPLYYVIAVSSDDLATASSTMQVLSRKSPVTLRDPFPWILYPSNR